MIFPPYYDIDEQLLSLISHIDANRIYISSLQPKKTIVEKIQQTSYLRSSLFSARIEGNRHTFEELDEHAEEQQEIFNILKGIQYITAQVQPGDRFNKQHLLTLHKLVTTGVAEQSGHFRKESSAIFNQAGIAIYVPPPPSEIQGYLKQLFAYINSQKEQFPLVRAFIAHLIFEKIHPFLDGNGRVGRLLIFSILQSKGYDFGLHVPFEEYLDNHRDQYYYHLDAGLQQANNYLLFMLTAFYEQTEAIKNTLHYELTKKEEVYLPPRQGEIYRIIQDQNMVSFDSIRRRFLKVPERTLRYDLKKLCDSGLVVKVGKTRGSFYTGRKNHG